MPSFEHEALLVPFRERPELAYELLRDVVGLPLPRFDRADTSDANLTAAQPAELRADLVVFYVDQRPVFAIVVEVQLSADPRKEYTWPLYLFSLRARLRCPVCLVVVSPDERVACWARQPVETGHPGLYFAPVVLGPAAIPRVTSPDDAKRSPELALLSVCAHGRGEQGLPVAVAAMTGIEQVEDEDRKLLYYDIIRHRVSPAVWRALEELMRTKNWQYQSEFARKYYGAGRELGRELGREEGREEGRLEGQARAIVTILESRGVPLSETQRHEILRCTDPETLTSWLERCPHVASADELLH